VVPARPRLPSLPRAGQPPLECGPKATEVPREEVNAGALATTSVRVDSGDCCDGYIGTGRATLRIREVVPHRQHKTWRIWPADMNAWGVLAAVVLAVHLTWIAWVIFGWLVARNRSVLRWFHFGSLIYGIFIEIAPWPCPLTLLEQWLEIEGRRCSLWRAIPGSLPGSSCIPRCARASAGFRGRGRMHGQPVPPRTAFSREVGCPTSADLFQTGAGSQGQVRNQLPAQVALLHDEFQRCDACVQ
jgi:hypothetical protein